MIRPLRRAHRAIVTILAFVVPVIVAAALSARQTMRIGGDHSAAPDWIAPTETEPGGFRVVSPRWEQHGAKLPAPDALVYWTATQPLHGSLPRDAIRLGALSQWMHRPFVPAGARPGSYLVVFSVARGEVVDTARVEVQP